MAADRPRSPLPLLLVLAALLALGLHAGRYLDFIVDDAYIYFRFAANVARGHGPVFNPGERVEGHSSTLWTLWLGAGGALGLDIPTFARATALALTLGVALLAWRLARRLGAPPLAAAAAPLLLAMSPPVALWGAVGMPMPLLVLLLLAATLAMDRELSDPGAWPWSGPILGLLALARPESFILPVLFTGFALVHGLCHDRLRAHRRQFLWRAAIALGAVAAFLLWRRLWYGHWLSNATYAKLGGDDGLFSEYARAQLRQGWYGYLRPFLLLHAALLLLALLAVPGWLRQRRRPVAWLAMGLVAFQVLLVLKAGGDWMPMWRFLVPVLALLAPFLAAGLADSLDLLRRRSDAAPRAPVLQAAVVAAVLVAGAHAAWRTERAVGPRLQAMRVSWASALRETPRLREVIPPGATVASCAMGVLPWNLLDNPFLDMVGLCNEHIAHHGRRALALLGLPDTYWEKADPDWVFGTARPDWVVIVRAPADGAAGSGPPNPERVRGSDGREWSVGRTSATNQLAAMHPLFQRDYELVTELQLDPPPPAPFSRRLFVYRRRAGA